MKGNFKGILSPSTEKKVIDFITAHELPSGVDRSVNFQYQRETQENHQQITSGGAGGAGGSGAGASSAQHQFGQPVGATVTFRLILPIIDNHIFHATH